MVLLGLGLMYGMLSLWTTTVLSTRSTVREWFVLSAAWSVAFASSIPLLKMLA
jgi:hypothetical protein